MTEGVRCTCCYACSEQIREQGHEIDRLRTALIRLLDTSHQIGCPFTPLPVTECPSCWPRRTDYARRAMERTQ